MLESSDALIKIDKASFSYPQSPSKALNGVSVSISPGEYVSVLGANGSGKSTLGRIMAGFYEPDSGTVEIKEGILPGIVFQQPKEQIVAGVVERDTAFGPQNLDMDKGEIELRTLECLSVVGLADRCDSRTFELSLGQTQRLAFSGILALFPDLLILDEVTAMLDPVARTELLQIVSRWHAQGHSVVHITHDRDEALMADRIIVMENGSVVFDGGRKEFMENAELCLSIFGDDSSLLTSEIDSTRLDELETSLSVEGLGFSYPDFKVFENLSFKLKKGTLTALTGPSGCGKSTLFECLAGLRQADSGRILASERPVLALQESEASLFEPYAADDVAFGPKNRGVEGKELLKRVKNSMELAGLSYEEFGNRGTFRLSGGEKRKLSLAGIIALDADVMIFDEPTSALDPLSRITVLESLKKLAASGKTVLFSTHRMEEAAFADVRLDWESLTENRTADECATGKSASDKSNQDGLESNVTDLKSGGSESSGLKQVSMMKNAGILKGMQKIENALTAPPKIPESPIKRLPATLKFLLFLLIFTATLASGNNIFCIAMLGVSIVYALLSRYPLKKPLYAYLKLLPWFIFFALIQTLFFASTSDVTPVLFSWKWLVITESKLDGIIRMFLRGPTIIITIGCFIYTTDERQLLDGLSGLLTPLALIKVPVRYFVLTIGIMFRFVPLLLDELSGIIKTQLVRGAFGKARGLGKIKIMLPLLVPLILQTFRKAQYLADALTARYFN